MQPRPGLFAGKALALIVISWVVAAFSTATLVVGAVVIPHVPACRPVSSPIAGAIWIVQLAAAILVLILALRVLLAGVPLARVLRPLVLGHGGLDRHRERSCEPCG